MIKSLLYLIYNLHGLPLDSVSGVKTTYRHGAQFTQMQMRRQYILHVGVPVRCRLIACRIQQHIERVNFIKRHGGYSYKKLNVRSKASALSIHAHELMIRSL